MDWLGCGASCCDHLFHFQIKVRSKMQKFLILFACFSLLGACSSEPQQQDENALPPGMMQPVLGTGATEDAQWQPIIEKQPMPESMN